MAYKFVNADQLDADLTTVAEAIRTKGETTELLSFPAGMASAISAISTGAELNFEVVGNPQPSRAKENTIWVNTEKVTGWYFSATQPENMQEGEVWILTGTESQIAFNALKKNGIMVYPLSAKQMVSSALVDLTAASYQNGEWVDWWNGEILDHGRQFEDLTGGWTADGYSNSAGAVLAGTITDDGLSMKGGSSYVLFGTNNAIDLSEYKTIEVEYTVISMYNNMSPGWIRVRNSKNTDYPTASAEFSNTLGFGTTQLDISSLSKNSNYYIWAQNSAWSQNSDFTVHKIRLVK